MAGEEVEEGVRGLMERVGWWRLVGDVRDEEIGLAIEALETIDSP